MKDLMGMMKGIGEMKAKMEAAQAEIANLVVEGKAGGGLVTLFVEDWDGIVESIAERGVEPTKKETYSNGVRKATFHDADGNEIGFGGPAA